jgi:hypothetical protein
MTAARRDNSGSFKAKREANEMKRTIVLLRSLRIRTGYLILSFRSRPLSGQEPGLSPAEIEERFWTFLSCGF